MCASAKTASRSGIDRGVSLRVPRGTDAQASGRRDGALLTTHTRARQLAAVMRDVDRMRRERVGLLADT